MLCDTSININNVHNYDIMLVQSDQHKKNLGVNSSFVYHTNLRYPDKLHLLIAVSICSNVNIVSSALWFS